MKRKFYEKPSMKVFELKQRARLLVGSDGGVDPLNPFTPGGSPI